MDGADQQPALKAWELDQPSGDITLETVFRDAPPKSPHLLILGDPGSGKTTALKKMAHLLTDKCESELGLDEGTLPVFVPLRSITTEILAGGLERFIDQELRDAAGKQALPKGIAQTLLTRGNLLILFDGLDEIGDETLRADACRHLDRWLSDFEGRGIRAAVSCRRLGYRKDVRFSSHFRSVEVRPLDQTHVEQLVRNWFLGVERSGGEGDAAEIQRQCEDLLQAFRDPPFDSHEYQVLVGNPLLLTILCVVVHHGHRMPRRRAQFFDQILQVLLQRRLSETAEKAPIDPGKAIALLRPIAWELHGRDRRDEITRGDLLNRMAGAVADPIEAARIVRWLHEQAAVLDQFAPSRFGFFHLGVQEYLTALHALADKPQTTIRQIAAKMREPWWREVGMMLAGAAGTEHLQLLLKTLLNRKGAVSRFGLIQECLSEAENPNPAPIVERLEGSTDKEEQAALVRLLASRSEDAFRSALSRVEDGHPDASLQDLARSLLAATSASMSTITPEVLLVFRPEDREAARTFADALRERGISVWGGAKEPPIPEDWMDDVDKVMTSCRLALWIAPEPRTPPWVDDDTGAMLPFLGRGMAQRALRMGRIPRGVTLPAPLDDLGWLACFGTRMAEGLSEIESVLRPVPKAKASKAKASKTGDVERGDQTIVDATTGITFLPVGAGSFQMGREDGGESERPVHEVRVDAFSMSRTPVTNRQYGAYLNATGAKEPPTWRDKRYSDPEQPVVCVSWQDAQDFCRWLSETDAQHGMQVRLPTEIEWEYAARGPESLIWPWGNTPKPSAKYACYGLDYNNPEHRAAAVGSFSAGKGPFGHLDLAGLVWEWCEDIWNRRVYSKRAQGELIPVNETGNKDWRVLRGGCWVSPAGDLAGAVRSGYRAAGRVGDFGFRVVSVPASTVAS